MHKILLLTILCLITSCSSYTANNTRSVTTPTPSATKTTTPENIPTKTPSIEYIGNEKAKKYHIPTCHTLPKEKNRVYFSTAETADRLGFSPCENCNP